VDGAFEQARDYWPADPQWGPLLFLEQTRPMRQDRRFMDLAVKYGFAAYWRSTGQWADFCKDPHLPYDCVKEVDRLARSNPDLRPITAQRAAIPY
jgi:hypothetical protein